MPYLLLVARRVSEIKVQIQDREALELVKPEALLALLERLGYDSRQERQGHQEGQGLVGWQFKLSVPEAAVGMGPRWVFVPAREDFADYVHRVAEAIADLAEVSGRSELDVLLELLGVEGELPFLPERD